jgi:hypothetical protein
MTTFDNRTRERNRTSFETFSRYADNSPAPKNAFYSKVQGGIYNVCDETLRTGSLHIIALNPGVGKTQFTNAYIGAMIEDDPKASALVVVEQIATVQERFETLHKLIPGKVGCWTTKFKTIERDQLRKLTIAVITHAAFMTSDDKLDEMDRCWRQGLRTLTVVDERLKGAKTFCCSAAIWPSYAGVVWSGPWRGYRASARLLSGSRPESRLVLGSARDEWLDPAVWRPDRLELDAADPLGFHPVVIHAMEKRLKTAQIALRMKPELKAAAEEAAKAIGRSRRWSRSCLPITAARRLK